MLDRRWVRTLTACVAVCLLCPSAGAAAEPSEYELLLPFSSQLGRATVSQIAVGAFIGRKWTVKSISDDRVVGYLDHRGIKATLELKILDDQIVYFCDCVKRRKSNGRSKQDRRYVAWTPVSYIDNLRRDIRSAMALSPALVPADARPVVQASDESIASRLQVLDDLLAQSLVSRDEYDAKRAEILSAL